MMAATIAVAVLCVKVSSSQPMSIFGYLPDKIRIIESRWFQLSVEAVFCRLAPRAFFLIFCSLLISNLSQQSETPGYKFVYETYISDQKMEGQSGSKCIDIFFLDDMTEDETNALFDCCGGEIFHNVLSTKCFVRKRSS